MRSPRWHRWIVLAPLSLACLACSGAEAPKKSALLVCEDGDEACSKTKDNRPKSGTASDVPGPTGDPVTVDEPATPTPSAPAPTADAGAADAPSEASTKECSSLDACCKQLQLAGYDPATCNGVVGTKNEAACFAQHDRYKQFGDCS